MYMSRPILSESDWLEGIESLLSYLTMSRDGLLVVTGDVNIDMQKPLSKHLASSNLSRNPLVTRTSKTLIDHIFVNFPQNNTYTDVILCSMAGDNDAPFACINVHVPRFQPRFKFLRNEKELDENVF